MLRLLGVRFTGDLRPDIEWADIGERRSWRHTLADLFAVLRERRMRSAERDLKSMDDHMLRDIGVERSDIASIVRYGRGFGGGWSPDKGH